jgi:hypothetical protein
MTFRTITIILFFAFVCSAKDIAFIGLNGEKAPAVEKTFDRLIREHLSVIPDVKSVDYLQIQKYQQIIFFSDNSTVSESLVELLEKYAPESTLFVWGWVKDYRITAVRRKLFNAALKGELTIGLTMYSLSEKKFAYSGNVKAEDYKSKGLIFFGSVDQSVHATALDRAEILEKLVNQAVENSGRIISAVAKSQTFTNNKDSDVQQYKVPSISDVFSVPSLEAPNLDQGNSKNSTSNRGPIPDSTGKKIKK